jgi:hypothetical protein
MIRILTEVDTDVTTTSENRIVNTNVIETRGRKKGQTQKIIKLSLFDTIQFLSLIFGKLRFGK